MTPSTIAAAATHIVSSPASQTITNGTTVGDITVTAKDDSGNTDTHYTTDATLSFDTPITVAFSLPKFGMASRKSQASVVHPGVMAAG